MLTYLSGLIALVYGLFGMLFVFLIQLSFILMPVAVIVVGVRVLLDPDKSAWPAYALILLGVILGGVIWSFFWMIGFPFFGVGP